MLGISKAVLKEEITLAQRILNKWQQKLDEGIPGVDTPAADEVSYEIFVRELVSELSVVANKMEGLAAIISEYRGS